MPSGGEHSAVSKVQGLGFDSFAHGQGTVAVSGTAVALSAAASIARGGEFTGTDLNTWFQSIVVKALPGNTGNIFVGGSAVTTANGFPLSPGDTVGFPLRSLADVFVDVAVNGEGFSFFAIL